MPRAQTAAILGYVLGWPSRWARAGVAMMDPVELDWLETFLAVVDRGGFTAASVQVHRSQSRVSAHIAGLEREIGVRLIDRSRRPATVTAAGRVFADHAREILADVRTARSALAAIRSLSDQLVHVQTTAGLGATLFPQVLAKVLADFPDATVTLAEHEPDDDQVSIERAVLIVAPPDRPAHPTARRETLWWEPLLVLVPKDHQLARAGAPVDLDRLAEHRLVSSATAGRAIDALTAAPDGDRARARLTVETPHTLAALVRAGLGVGVINGSSVAMADLSGLIVFPFAETGEDPPPGFDVAVDWFDVLLTSPVGRALHEAVLAAPVPPGALDRRHHR